MAFENRKYLILPKSEVTKEDDVISPTLNVVRYGRGNNAPTVIVNSKIEVTGGTGDVTDHTSWSSFKQSLLYSVDGTKTFIKWDGTNPSYLSSISGTEGPYSHTEMTTILSGSDWNISL